MKILLVRHGQTDINKQKRIQGVTDNPLNEKGIQQAHKIGKYLKENNFKFDVAYSSPLIRAYKTGQIILSYFNEPKTIIKSDYFMERNFGPYEGKLVALTLNKVYNPNFRKEGYEDDPTLIKRVMTGLDYLYEKEKGKTVILFCHSHVIKPFLITANKEKYNFRTLLKNGSSHLFSYDGKNLKLLKFNLATP